MFLRSLRIVLCILGIGLSGCSSLNFIQNSSGVGVPTPSEEANYAAATFQGVHVTGPDGKRYPILPGVYIIATVVHTNEKCNEFFDMLEKFKQDSKMLSKVIAAANASGSPLIAIATASGAAVAQFTSALTFGDAINTSYAEIYTFSEFKDPLKRLVFEAMTDYQRKKGIDLYFERQVGVIKIQRVSIDDTGKPSSVGNPVNLGGSGDITFTQPAGTDPADPKKSLFDQYTVSREKLEAFITKSDESHLVPNSLIARNVGVEYASLCSLASMKQIVFDALAKAQGGANTGGTGSPATATANPAVIAPKIAPPPPVKAKAKT